VPHTDGVLVRVLEGGAIGDGRRIEHDHVGEEAGRDPPSVTQAQVRGG
jgi:hypothetical protein